MMERTAAGLNVKPNHPLCLRRCRDRLLGESLHGPGTTGVAVLVRGRTAFRLKAGVFHADRTVVARIGHGASGTASSGVRIAPGPVEIELAAVSNGSGCRADSIVTLIAENPGIHVRELCRRMDTAWGGVAFHVQNLLRGGRVVALREGRFVLLFDPSLPIELRRVVAAIREVRGFSLLRRLQQGPARSVRQLAQEMGANRRTVRRQVIALAKIGVVEVGDSIRLVPGATRRGRLNLLVDLRDW
jgi:predicted DNA-binding transcriptional regulator